MIFSYTFQSQFTQFSLSGSQTFFGKLLAPFFQKNQHLYKASLAQSLPFMGFYVCLKYLHKFQSHPVYLEVICIVFVISVNKTNKITKVLITSL
jgi:hypothetical protein